MSGPLGREQLVELFEELSLELAKRGARAHVYVFGGAAMSVAFDRGRTTVDIDVRVPPLAAQPQEESHDIRCRSPTAVPEGTVA